MNSFRTLSGAAIVCLIIIFYTSAAVAQGEQNMMMDGGMMDGGMMSGWIMVACILLGVLLFIALILAILALLKYLFGK